MERGEKIIIICIKIIISTLGAIFFEKKNNNNK